MVFIKSGEIIIPYPKKAIVCSMVFIKSGEIIIPYQKKLSYAAWFSLKVEK